MREEKNKVVRGECLTLQMQAIIILYNTVIYFERISIRVKGKSMKLKNV